MLSYGQELSTGIQCQISMSQPTTHIDKFNRKLTRGKKRAQPALTPPLGGSRLAFAMQRHVDRKGFPEIYTERQT